MTTKAAPPRQRTMLDRLPHEAHAVLRRMLLARYCIPYIVSRLRRLPRPTACKAPGIYRIPVRDNVGPRPRVPGAPGRPGPRPGDL